MLMDVWPVLITFMQGALLLFIAPLVVGVLNWLRARFQKRQGAGWLQVYRDLFKLFRKPASRPESASWLFAAAPYIILICYSSLGFVLPVIHLAGWLQADLIVLFYVLGLARFVLGLAGMDAGTSFGGLGSSREMSLHAFAEPAVLLMIFALALQRHTTSLSGMIKYSLAPGLTDVPALLALFAALALLVVVEAGRLPVDNPHTHLELTMIGKAIHLEYAGRHLALLEWAEAIRLTVYLTLLINLFVPWGVATGSEIGHMLAAGLLYMLKLLVLVGLLAVWEAAQVKLRLRRIDGHVFLIIALILVGIVYIVAVRYLSGG